MIAIFASLDSALAFDAAVCAAMGWPDATTKRYAVPAQHPTDARCAVPVLDYAVPFVPATAFVVDELSADWTPPPSMP